MERSFQNTALTNLFELNAMVIVFHLWCALCLWMESSILRQRRVMACYRASRELVEWLFADALSRASRPGMKAARRRRRPFLATKHHSTPLYASIIIHLIAFCSWLIVAPVCAWVCYVGRYLLQWENAGMRICFIWQVLLMYQMRRYRLRPRLFGKS